MLYLHIVVAATNKSINGNLSIFCFSFYSILTAWLVPAAQYNLWFEVCMN